MNEADADREKLLTRLTHPVVLGHFALFLLLATGLPAYVVYRIVATKLPYRLEATADELTRTIVVPHPDHPLDGGDSLIWCSTFRNPRFLREV